MSLLAASIGETVASPASEVARSSGEKQLADPTLTFSAANDERACEPPAMAAELRG